MSSSSELLATCLKIGGQEICDAFPTPADSASPTKSFTTIGDVISRLMEYVFPFAGIILLVVFISAGFDYMRSAGESSKISSAQKKVTFGALGFFLLLASYLIIRTVAIVLDFESPV
jgi:hypothetical protein